MSPARRRQQFVPARPRSEVVTAVAVGAGIVAGTALLVWLLRPGTAGVPGGGGLFSRQPRATLLILVAAAAVGLLVAFVLRRAKAPRFGTAGSIALGTAVVVVLAVIAGVFWPGGVVRHWPSLPKQIQPPASVPSTATPAPTAKTGTTVRTSTTRPAPTASTTRTAASTSSTPTTKGG